MPKGLRIVGYVLVGIVSFVVFLYFTFPFDILKDRILAGVEKGLKEQYQIDVGSVSPRLIAGVTLKSVKVIERGEGESDLIWEAEKIRLKVSLLSLIVRVPRIKFDISSGGGRISGRLVLDKTKTKVELELDEFNLGKFAVLASKYGLNLKSGINGGMELDIDPRQFIRSNGVLNIEPNTIDILASKLKAGEMGEIDLPAIKIGAGKSIISAELQKGAIQIKSFRLEDGDLNMDLKGSIYLSNDIKNFRLNLNGTFDFSEKVGQALPFLFIIEKQKGEDGTYPITIAGRLSRPQIKIGDFNLPL